jgi:hypothetical protein
VPEGVAPTQYCYNVYDVPSTFDGVSLMPLVAFTEHCQDAPANYGDMLNNFYNPDLDQSFDYMFRPESQICFEPIVENAYYNCSMSCAN